MSPKGLAFAFAFVAACRADIILPAGTELHIRLTTKVSSTESKPGQAVKGVVFIPVLFDGLVAVQPGADLLGKVDNIGTDGRATMRVSFTGFSIDGKTIPIQARLAEVDNAREVVDEAGQIIGILPGETLAGRAQKGIEKLSERNSALAGLLNAARTAVLSEAPNGDIRYDPGVELKLVLTAPLKLPGKAGHYEIDEISGDIEKLVKAQPLRTVAQKPPKPSDLTNLMFIGTEDALKAAFKAAGWDIAKEINAESVLETVRAIAEVGGYKEAPMSTLLLDGRRSDFDYQKGNNTFAKRHHLRIWRRDAAWEGRPVWLCAATHDTGITFSQESRTFTHTIDTNIDRERAKVVSDLLFTKRVKAISLVPRPDAPLKTANATGDEIITDGMMAVLVLE